MPRARVVVGVAGATGGQAPASGQALPWALAEASATGRGLLICHSCAPDSALAVPGAGARMSLLELVEPALARAVAAARLRLGGDRVTLMVRAQPPDQLLTEVSTAADMLVVGAPTRSGWLERRSTTHQVVRHARSPVVVVRPAEDSSAAAGHPLLAGHVVVGVDGSAPSRAALEFGFGYAAEHHRPVAVVHVEPRVETDVAFDDRLRELQLGSVPGALAILADEIEPWQHKFPDVTVKRALYGGRPLAGLLRASIGSTLLCVGRSGRGLARALTGSVTHGAIDRAPCPVAVVREDPGWRGRGGIDPDDGDVARPDVSETP